MKKVLFSLALAALVAVPAGAQASPCRNAKGHFAKCGTPGALPPGGAGKPADKPAGPAMAPMMKPSNKHAGPAMAPMMKPADKHVGPAMAPVKKGPCKDAKGKFAKC
jgi:hypothetical protein